MTLAELRGLIDKRTTQHPPIADMPVEVHYGQADGLYIDDGHAVLTIKEP